jgi:DNA-binding LacI/PurR family transcriptional regulator
MNRPTMEDVAAEAGVSRALVSLVMRDSPRVSTRSRDAVRAAADRLGYRPNLMARNLAAGRTTTFGLLLNDLNNPWFAEIGDSVNEAAETAGYQVIIATARRSPAVEERAVEWFLAHRVDGIVLTGSRLPAKRIAEHGRTTPLVSVGRPVRSDHLDTVNNDEHVGARLAVGHLAALGHRRITHLDGGQGAGAAPRRTGYQAAMRAIGLGDEIDIVTGDFTEDAGLRGVEQLLHRGRVPTAIFAANDLVAIGALARLEDAGYRVPDDVSIVGYDDTTLSALRHVSLTTIAQSQAAMGRRAVELLLERIGGRREPRHEVTPAELVVRCTTGPAPRS